MTTRLNRKLFVRNLWEVEPQPTRYPDRDEVFGARARLSRPLGLERLGVHLDVLKPGQRSSLPHAESTEEEGVLVLEGCPGLWVDGECIPLKTGDFVAFVPGSGIAHTILNQTSADVRMLTVGERRSDNQVVYPLDEARTSQVPVSSRWTGAPKRSIGEVPPIARRESQDGCDRVSIRLPDEADCPDLYEMVTGGSVCDTILWDGPADYPSFVRSVLDNGERTRDGELHFFVIDYEGQPAGCIDVRPSDDRDTADIGLWVGEPFQGKGVGTAAVRQIVDHARSIGVRRIEASIFLGNWASRRIFEKNGFMLEGILRQVILKRGVPTDEWVFALLPE